MPGPRPIATGERGVDLLTWAGGRLVGADSQGLGSVLLVWDDPEQPPRELARVPGRVQGLAPAPDGRHVAIEAAYPEDPSRWSLDDPASLALLELRSGRVRTLVGATRGASLRGAAWSPDSRRLAVAGLEAPGPDPTARRRPVTLVLDADSGTNLASTDPTIGLEPLRWDAEGLWLHQRPPLGAETGPTYRWAPGHGDPEPTEAPPWPSPDGRYSVERTTAGLAIRKERSAPRTIEPSDPEEAAALRTWTPTGQPAWCGTHHLALRVGDEILALDLASLRWRPLAPVGTDLPRADASGHRLILRSGAEPWWGWAP